jgi:hypothetical protein
MLYNGFVVVDTRDSQMAEFNNAEESNYPPGTYAGPGGAPSGTYGPNLPGSSGGSSGPLPGLGGTGWGGSQSGGGQSRGGAGQYINADTIAAGTNLLGGIFGAIGASKAAKGPIAGNVKAVCGRKPLFNIGGKKDRYFACAERVANPQPVFRETPPPESNKGLIIGLIVAVVLIGIIITVVLVMKNKKAAVA